MNRETVVEIIIGARSAVSPEESEKAIKEAVAEYLKTEKRDAAYRRIISEYGADPQIDVAIEEMSELIKALLKLRRVHKKGDCESHLECRKAIIDELADVSIMIRQMEILFQAEEETDKRIDTKIARQLKRLEGDI